MLNPHLTLPSGIHGRNSRGARYVLLRTPIWCSTSSRPPPRKIKLEHRLKSCRTIVPMSDQLFCTASSPSLLPFQFTPLYLISLPCFKEAITIIHQDFYPQSEDYSGKQPNKAAWDVVFSSFEGKTFQSVPSLSRVAALLAAVPHHTALSTGVQHPLPAGNAFTYRMIDQPENVVYITMRVYLELRKEGIFWSSLAMW